MDEIKKLEKLLEEELKKNHNKYTKRAKELELSICSLNNHYFEDKCIKQGNDYIAGVDEVGRGPLIGPVVVACVILPKDFKLEGLTDSKKLTEKQREKFYDIIMDKALSVSISLKSAKVIDEVNIYEATKLAMYDAIKKSKIKPDHVLIDAMKLENLDIPSTSIIKGDIKSITISAASVIAKVTRDRMLDDLDKIYPMYDLKNNKGYPTKKHIEAIEQYGIVEEHRKTFNPVSKHLNHINKLQNLTQK